MRNNAGAAALALALLVGPARAADPAPLPGTRALIRRGDVAAAMVDGIDRFLLRKTEESVAGRARYWSKEAGAIEANRKRLAQILGVRDARPRFAAPELVGTTARPARIGRGAGYAVFAIRWPAFGDVQAEGLLLAPEGEAGGVADVVAIPDADQTPEQLAGLAEGLPPEAQFARRLAEAGCRVVVPTLIDRSVEPRGAKARLTNREYLYRPAFELGRHVIGYEVQEVLAAVDWFARERGAGRKIGVVGWGEGGLLALAAGALDPRIDAVGVSGYFADRRDSWREPIDRNVFGFLERFGDAELAALIAPQTLIVEAARGPEFVVPPGTGGAPGRLATPAVAEVRAEVDRARALTAKLDYRPHIELILSGDGTGPPLSGPLLSAFLTAVAPGSTVAPQGPISRTRGEPADPDDRQRRLIHAIDRHNQELLAGSADVRREFFARLDTSSPDAYRRTIEPYRATFRDEVIGRFEDAPLPPAARSRKIYDEPTFDGYEVVMDVFPDVNAAGILLVPKGIKPGERRPVVVCQHGLEGRPQDVADPNVDNPAYHHFAATLAGRGFVTFAPQNPYLFGDRFRTLQRKANPLKKSLFSIIVPQHQQITDWLKTLPFADGERIAFYGLSYGGKTAMRVPPLVSNYCLSICSADFNEWIWKNASTHSPYSYVRTDEYEIYEFDLGNTFNYAEMAALIAPRPFMVERGHFDGVGPDEAVGAEFAKVRLLYEGRLGLMDRCAIEWFAGPHTIHGVGTFDFLHEHLRWPKR